MIDFKVSYNPPGETGKCGCLSITYPKTLTLIAPLAPGANVHVDEDFTTQRIQIDPGNVAEVIEAAWVIVRFILAIIGQYR